MQVAVILRPDIMQTYLRKGLDYVLNMSSKNFEESGYGLDLVVFFVCLAAKHPIISLCFTSCKKCASCDSNHLKPIYLTRVGSNKPVKHSASEQLEEWA